MALIRRGFDADLMLVWLKSRSHFDLLDASGEGIPRQDWGPINELDRNHMAVL